MKEIAFALDIRDDPDAIRAYRVWHKKVWPEIMRGTAEIGVQSQRIYLSGNRLFMVLQVEDDFDYRKDFVRYLKDTPRAEEWEALMQNFQQQLPWAEGGEWWYPMERVYDLNEQLREVGGDPRRRQSQNPVLDTHHHFWKVERGDYFWMTPDMPIVRDFMPEDLAPFLRKSGVAKTILVQAANTEAETNFLLEVAESCEFVVGVCGWLDMESSSFADRLAHYMKHPLWKSFRPMLQDLEDPAWILRPQIMANLAHVAKVGARFEFLVKPAQLPYAVEAIKQTPGLKAVINHIAKPEISSGAAEPWASQIAVLGDYPNIFCKLSGMVTEADAATWTPEDLRPYVTHILNVFGPDRIMFGSDWPVALLAASSYGEVVNALRTIVGPLLGPEEHSKLFHDNGAQFYGICD